MTKRERDKFAFCGQPHCTKCYLDSLAPTKLAEKQLENHLQQQQQQELPARSPPINAARVTNLFCPDRVYGQGCQGRLEARCVRNQVATLATKHFYFSSPKMIRQSVLHLCSTVGELWVCCELEGCFKSSIE